MNKLSKFGLGVLILASALIVAILLFIFKPEAKKTPPQQIIPTVEVQAARPVEIELTIPSQGIIEPITKTQAAAEVAGRVISVSPKFEAGESFRQEEVLLEIDPADYKAALATAEASLADARLNLELEKAKADQAARDWQKLGSDKPPTDLVLRKPHLLSAQAHVDSALAGVEKARNDLERTKLRAPYNGRIKSTSTDLGSYATPGAPLAELYATDTLEIRLPVSLGDYAFVGKIDNEGNKHPRVVLYTEVAGERYDWDAKVVRTEGQVDRASRSIYLVARMDTAAIAEKYGNVAVDVLAPGLFVKADVQGSTLRDVFRVPRKAFYQPDTVVMIDVEDRLFFRPVTVLRSDGKDLLVSSDYLETPDGPHGIAPGDRICLTALDTVVEGMKVNILESEKLPGDGEITALDPPQS